MVEKEDNKDNNTSLISQLYGGLDITMGFDGEIFIMDKFVPKIHIFEVLKEEYIENYQFIQEVDYVWMSYGRFPKEVDAEGNGWFVIDNPKNYKRKRKATLVIIKEFESIRKCPKCKSNRVTIMNGVAECSVCGFKINYKPLSFCNKCYNNTSTIDGNICGRCGTEKKEKEHSKKEDKKEE